MCVVYISAVITPCTKEKVCIGNVFTGGYLISVYVCIHVQDYMSYRFWKGKSERAARSLQ